MIGVVVSKHAPISQFHKDALLVLAQNQSGVVYTATEPNGTQRNFVESQLVADILGGFRQLTQVMIGEAISVEVLQEFLKENSII